MKIIFSPSKGMNKKKINLQLDEKKILFPEKTEKIIKKLQTFSKEEIGNLMKIKGTLLSNTYENILNYTKLESIISICLYDGVSFSNLDLEKYKEKQFKYLEKYCRIFSALYGVITPSTLIKPYRLDMTMKIFEESLYNYWKNSVEKEFYKNEIIINLASGEFSKLLNRKEYKFIDIEFRQIQGENIKNISNEAKKMRGKFLDFLIKNNIDDLNIEKIKSFSQENYKLNIKLCEDNKYFFTKNI